MWSGKMALTRDKLNIAQKANMQISYMTVPAFEVALRQSAKLLFGNSALRVAALAQPKPYTGRWQTVRLQWSDEPERVTGWRPAPPVSLAGPSHRTAFQRASGAARRRRVGSHSLLANWSTSALIEATRPLFAARSVKHGAKERNRLPEKKAMRQYLKTQRKDTK